MSNYIAGWTVEGLSKEDVERGWARWQVHVDCIDCNALTWTTHLGTRESAMQVRGITCPTCTLLENARHEA